MGSGFLSDKSGTLIASQEGKRTVAVFFSIEMLVMVPVSISFAVGFSNWHLSPTFHSVSDGGLGATRFVSSVGGFSCSSCIRAIASKRSLRIDKYSAFCGSDSRHSFIWANCS